VVDKNSFTSVFDRGGTKNRKANVTEALLGVRVDFHTKIDIQSGRDDCASRNEIYYQYSKGKFKLISN
jgi:hypothetical protein